MQPTTPQAAFAAFQSTYTQVRRRAEAVTNSIHERGWRIAAAAGIPRCMCCLHNASIDDAMTGWCAGNPERLKAAKRAVRLLDDWSASRLADRLYARMWNRFLSPFNYAQASIPQPPKIIPAILFAHP